MVLKKYLQGIALVVLILGMLSVAMAALITNPTGDQSVSDVSTNLSRTFSITTSYNASVNWYLNGTLKNSTLNVTPSSYTNNSFAIGFWNVTAIATNSSDGNDTEKITWWWTITAAPTSETAPSITVGPTASPLDTSANISFTVNQSNANTTVRYGTDQSLSLETTPLISGTSRVIQLTGLSKGTLYYYSVFARNASNTSLVSNSSIQNFTTLNPTAPNISNINQGTPSENSVSISFEVNQSDAKTQIKYGEDTSLSSSTFLGTLRTIVLSSLNQGTKYYYSIFAYNATNQTYSNNSTILNFTTKYPAPTIASIDPSNATAIDLPSGESKNLSVTVGSQNGTLSWYKNDVFVTSKSVNAAETVIYTFNETTKGTYKITANLSNSNGSVTKIWTINVRPATYTSGNRVWDGDANPADFSTKYSWNPMSFSGFYYNAKDDVGNEKITIELASNKSRTIAENKLTYTTSP